MAASRRAQLIPREGARFEDLLRVVREVHTSLINLRGRAPGGTALPELYPQWVDESVRMLRAVSRAEDVERLVLTRRYWAIVAIPGPTPFYVVNTEIDERLEQLAATLEDLEQTRRKWSEIGGRLMVADTTLFCQHPVKVRDIDFADMLACRDAPIRLMLPVLVLDELEGLKRSGRQHTRWRAAHTLGVLDEVLSTEGVGMLKEEDFSALGSGGIPRGRVDVEVYFDPPRHVRAPINDDELIERARAVASESGKRVTFVTYDTAQSTRAGFAGLAVRKLREDPGPEPDPGN